jgi:hypothetical protein
MSAPRKDFASTIRSTFGLEDEIKKPSPPDVSIALDSFPEDVRDVVQIFDKDGDGTISRSELAMAADMWIESKNSVKRLRIYLGVGVATILLLFLGIFGLIWAVVILTKETKLTNAGAVVSNSGAAQLTKTAPVTQTVSHALASWLPDATFDALRYIVVESFPNKLRLNVNGWGRTQNRDGTYNVSIVTNLGLITVVGTDLYSASMDVHNVLNLADMNAVISATYTSDNRRRLQTTSDPVSQAETHCPSGQVLDGKFTCTNCPVDSFSGTGHACENCQSETSTLGQVGQSSCSWCPYGVNCILGKTQCPRGSASDNLNGVFPCSMCSPGAYSDVMGSQTCKKCPAGSITGKQGQTSCTLCPVGTYASLPGSPVCSKCPTGSVSTTPGSYLCQSCSAGQSPMADQTGCNDCPAGQFSRSGLGCAPCAAGYYSANPKTAVCTKCPSGYTSNAGSSSCSIPI